MRLMACQTPRWLKALARCWAANRDGEPQPPNPEFRIGTAKYLLNRRLVLTTEDFIALAATKSSMSGNAYLVQCSGQSQTYSADWMTAQLREIRAQQGEAIPRSN